MGLIINEEVEEKIRNIEYSIPTLFPARIEIIEVIESSTYAPFSSKMEHMSDAQDGKNMRCD